MSRQQAFPLTQTPCSIQDFNRLGKTHPMREGNLLRSVYGFKCESHLKHAHRYIQMLEQMSGHLVAQSSRHIKLTTPLASANFSTLPQSPISTASAASFP